MPLVPRRSAFSHPDWLFEIKWDGFRSLAVVEHGKCRLISRNGNEFKTFADLGAVLPSELRADAAVLDGEIVCLDATGKPQFRDLLFRRGEPHFYAFDLLRCDGQDMHHAPLVERKFRLRSIVRPDSCGLLYCDHMERDGDALFNLACSRDLEGIVAKRKFDPYLLQHATWYKIRNKKYSQWVGREELFERERAPEMAAWGGCVEACEALAELE